MISLSNKKTINLLMCRMHLQIYLDTSKKRLDCKKPTNSVNVSVPEFHRSIRFKSVFKRKTTDVCKYWNAYV